MGEAGRLNRKILEGAHVRSGLLAGTLEDSSSKQGFALDWTLPASRGNFLFG